MLEISEKYRSTVGLVFGGEITPPLSNRRSSKDGELCVFCDVTAPPPAVHEPRGRAAGSRPPGPVIDRNISGI